MNFYKIKLWYRRHNPPIINREGIHYNRKTGKYETYYYNPNTREEIEVGKYNKLSDAVIAQDSYNKAMTRKNN